jgi:hypothetical protein
MTPIPYYNVVGMNHIQYTVNALVFIHMMGKTCMNSGNEICEDGNEHSQNSQHLNCGLLRDDTIQSVRWLPVVSDKPTASRFTNIKYRKSTQSFHNFVKH